MRYKSGTLCRFFFFFFLSNFSLLWQMSFRRQSERHLCAVRFDDWAGAQVRVRCAKKEVGQRELRDWLDRDPHTISLRYSTLYMEMAAPSFLSPSPNRKRGASLFHPARRTETIYPRLRDSQTLPSSFLCVFASDRWMDR